MKTISAIPPGIKKLIDDWTKRYARATLEEQVLMGTELVGQIEAFIVTFALAGTKAGQASTLGVRGGGTGVKVGAGGVAALSKAAVVSIPAVVPKTVAEAAVVATMMASMGSKGGAPPALGAGGGSPGKPETIKVKEPEVPEDTHGIRKTPGGAAQAESVEVGNFVHNKQKFYERLREWIPGKPDVTSDVIPPDAIAEYPVKRFGYTPGKEPKIDRLDRANHTVIEIKTSDEYARGLGEAKTYAQDMDILEPLTGGQRWKAKCVTYDFIRVRDYLRKFKP